MCTVSPREPRRKPAHVRLERPLHLGHRGHAPNRRHVALVEVAERRPLRPRQIRRHHLSPRGRPSASPAAPPREPGCPSCSRCARSPSTKTSGSPGGFSRSSTSTQPRWSTGAPSILPSGEACTPAAHSVTAASIRPCRSSPSPPPSPAQSRHLRIRVHLHAQLLQSASAFAERSAGYAASTRGEPSSSSTRDLGRIDVPEIVLHIELRNVADRPGQLHARRPAANHHKIQRRMPAMLHHLPLGQLKGQQHPPPNLGGVLNRLQPRRKRRPLLIAKVGVRRPRSPAPGSRSPTATRSPASTVAPPHRCPPPRPSALRYSAGAAECPDRLRNVRRRKHRQRHLVKQRLKQVIVAPVEHRHVHRQVRQPLAACRPANPPPTITTRGRRPRCATAVRSGCSSPHLCTWSLSRSSFTLNFSRCGLTL